MSMNFGALVSGFTTMSRLQRMYRQRMTARRQQQVAYLLWLLRNWDVDKLFLMYCDISPEAAAKEFYVKSLSADVADADGEAVTHPLAVHVEECTCCDTRCSAMQLCGAAPAAPAVSAAARVCCAQASVRRMTSATS